MNSRLIYSANDKIKSKVVWTKIISDSEWIYFGENDKAEKALVIDIICKHFTDEILNVVFTRKDFLQTTKINIEKTIDNLLGFQNFWIWDTSFKNVIEFNQIGTLRYGQLK